MSLKSASLCKRVAFLYAAEAMKRSVVDRVLPFLSRAKLHRELSMRNISLSFCDQVLKGK